MKTRSSVPRKICVVTGSRAEYGLLWRLMAAIKSDRALALQVVVTGTHLEKRFGSTYRQILADGFKISAKVPMGLDADTDLAVTCSAGEAVAGLGREFARLRPDIIVLLGDRFEILAAAVAATLMRLPVAHIHGGEVTEGAYDDTMRHAVTKMAHLHFVTHPEHARRVVQMGEDPRRVFVVGAPGLDNIRELSLLDKKALEKELKFALGPDTAMVTFHPVTLQKGEAGRHIRCVLDALGRSGLRCIFTMPNADPENTIIRRAILDFVRKKGADAKAVASLGSLRYLSLMQHVAVMVGNSSSGLIEAPSFMLPVVNIGDRQKGRLRAQNVLDAADNADAILAAIHKAVSPRFVASLRGLSNPYGDGRAAPRIKNVLKKTALKSLLLKQFRDAED
ncbi:MAG: UDP-N-acetylglucosamine 2-epimerase (hydrolyzing) [Candidatus Omnitrophica bacterium]|nr:UDP-N-acetylglucosamine 2-epimerase (hydrolyzing) [Candidatus Omnitrophota bacterium]